MFPLEIFDLDPGIGLFQDPNNLRFTESCSFHENLLAALCQKALFLTCPRFGEAYRGTGNCWTFKHSSRKRPLND